jgi:hypothetical protein
MYVHTSWFMVIPVHVYTEGVTLVLRVSSSCGVLGLCWVVKQQLIW